MKKVNMEDLIYYQDDPNLGFNTVTTATGLTEYRKNCKKIKGEYYTLNKECFLIDGIWYRINTGLIEFDHETKQWFLVKSMKLNMQKGIVGFEKGVPIKGHFTHNPYKNVPYTDAAARKGIAIDADVLKDNGYIEYVSNGVFYHKSVAHKSDCAAIINSVDHTNKGYNIEDNAAEFENKIELYKNYPLEISEAAKKYAKLLGKTTFGIEIECSKGYMPDYAQSRTGIIICRDGSLKDESGRPGPEFVSVPLEGAKGLQNIVEISRFLKGRTAIDLKCSLHIHLGNIPETRLFLVALYKLGCKIQNEIFQLFPYYKANPEGIKNKNYNQKLPNLQILTADKSFTRSEFDAYVDDGFRKIFSWLAEGQVPDNIFTRKVFKHPRENKWERSKRYYWLNVMNAIFSKRNTIEFRPHTPTTNSTKTIAWLFICNAIIKYAEANPEKILMKKGSIPLSEVLSYYPDNFGEDGMYLAKYLNSYIEYRKEVFYKDYMKGDKISEWEMEQDEDFVFEYNGKKSLI